MRSHWENCLTHFDADVDHFVGDYFACPDRRCLLVAGAGFDPRAWLVAQKLAGVMGNRLFAFLIREERGNAAANLLAAADANESKLKSLIPNATVAQIPIFAEDSAPVGGRRISEALYKHPWPNGVTDVVLDMSALSIGIAFPAAKYLLARCESTNDLSFHAMISSNPELDARIHGEPTDRAISIHGFPDRTGTTGELPVARIWLPQLARGQDSALAKVRAATDNIYKVCPILPFPARDPRRADELIAEFGSQISLEWEVDPRDLIYVSERNPLDSYRTISTLKQRYDRTVEDVYAPHIILSPLGSKVIAAGAMMAAIDHELTVKYVETLRYEFNGAAQNDVPDPADMIVHVWLHGPAYAAYVS